MPHYVWGILKLLASQCIKALSVTTEWIEAPSVSLSRYFQVTVSAENNGLFRTGPAKVAHGLLAQEEKSQGPQRRFASKALETFALRSHPP